MSDRELKEIIKLWDEIEAALAECDEVVGYMSEYDKPLCMSDRIKKALANIAKLKQMPIDGWLDIESAPKDYSHINLWADDADLTNSRGIFIGYWDDDINGWREQNGNATYMPTKWMPLPTPPER
jgi:hypothetical protein